MVAATGVLVAAGYYILNMRETSRSRKVALTNNLLQAMFSEEGTRRHISLLNMEWTDLEDFKRKYDSKINEEDFVKRTVFLTNVNYMSYLIEEGLLDIGSVYEVCGEAIMDNWLKFESIYEIYAKGGMGFGRDIIANVEYLAREMIRMKALRDPTRARWQQSCHTVDVG
jgi:hypothetical protein